MVRKIIGYDASGKKVFERDAREYDKSVSGAIFGISIGDIVKAVPVVFLCGIVYANQQNVNSHLMGSISEVSKTTALNSEAIGGLKDTLKNLDNYLSASTGKPFYNGRQDR